MAVDANLPPWTEIETKDEWSGLLVGNGASRAVWDRRERRQPCRMGSLRLRLALSEGDVRKVGKALM
jgi:hypothetical protein